MSGFVYIWRDRKYNRYYIGSHWGTQNDGYICSSPWMKSSYKRRPLDFKRKILAENIDDRIELYNEEQKWFNQIKPHEIGVKYYNLTLKVGIHWTANPEKRLTIGQKISKKHKGRKVWNKGVSPSKETKQKLRDAANKQWSNDGARQHTSETVKKLWQDPKYRKMQVAKKFRKII